MWGSHPRCARRWLLLGICAAGTLTSSFRTAAGQIAIPHNAEVARGTETPPVPDVVSLMRSVEAKQRAAEKLEQDYTYRSSIVETHTDSSGQPKKTETRDFDVFWLQGVPVNKLIAKDGKLLSPDELRKEDQRIDKEVQKARERRSRNDAAGKQTDPQGDEEITVSRMLELGTFGNGRRVVCNGRATIAVDYLGDPHAKTRNRAESAFRNLAGTVWVDEQDREVVQIEGHFAHSFKIAGGLLADIHEGTRFSLQQNKVNGQVWLPTQADASGSARLLLFSVHGTVTVRNSDFRRFRATSTVLPGVSAVSTPP